MRCDVRWSPEARDDLFGILDYVSQELKNPSAAERAVTSILDRVESLRAHPRIGRELPETVDAGFPCRHFSVGAYRIFYRLEGNVVFVVRVLHSLQDHMAALFPVD